MADQLAWESTEQYLALLVLILIAVPVGIAVSEWWDKHRRRAADIVARRTRDAARTKGIVAVDDPSTDEIVPLYVADCGQMAPLPADLFVDAIEAAVPICGVRYVRGHGLIYICDLPGHADRLHADRRWGRVEWYADGDLDDLDDPKPTLREVAIGEQMEAEPDAELVPYGLGQVHPGCADARGRYATDLICGPCGEVFAREADNEARKGWTGLLAGGWS